MSVRLFCTSKLEQSIGQFRGVFCVLFFYFFLGVGGREGVSFCFKEKCALVL